MSHAVKFGSNPPCRPEAKDGGGEAAPVCLVHRRLALVP